MANKKAFMLAMVTVTYTMFRKLYQPTYTPVAVSPKLGKATFYE